MARVEIRYGSEGPRHDPYGYEEIVVTTTAGRKLAAHFGLVNWFRLDGRTIVQGDTSDVLHQLESRAGVALRVLYRAYLHGRSDRCGCGGRLAETVPGMPGETLTVCSSCGAIGAVTFNRAAIE